jgi:hypothetical protein
MSKTAREWFILAHTTEGKDYTLTRPLAAAPGHEDHPFAGKQAILAWTTREQAEAYRASDPFTAKQAGWEPRRYTTEELVELLRCDLDLCIAIDTGPGCKGGRIFPILGFLAYLDQQARAE